MTITSENYVENVLHTDAPITEELLERLHDPKTVRLLHAAMGLSTEAGELLDMLKKHIFYGKPFDTVNAAEETGDTLWYAGLAIDVLRMTMDDVLTMNIKKLRLRYPEKFSGKQAIQRDTVAERRLLESGPSQGQDDALYRRFIRAQTKDCQCPPPALNIRNATYDQYIDAGWTDEQLITLGLMSKNGIWISNAASTATGKCLCDPHTRPLTTDDLKKGVDLPTGDTVTLVASTRRGANWLLFATKVLDHIENYTVPQYGDEGEDQATEWSAAHCALQVRKYGERHGRNARSGQEELDMMKAAHYASLTVEKLP